MQTEVFQNLKFLIGISVKIVTKKFNQEKDQQVKIVKGLHFITGQTWEKLAIEILIAKIAAQQFGQRNDRQVKIVQEIHFTIGQNFKLKT